MLKENKDACMKNEDERIQIFEKIDTDPHYLQILYS